SDGNQRADVSISGFQKIKMSIFSWYLFSIASSLSARSRRSSWRRPPIFQLADSSAKIRTLWKCGSVTLIRGANDAGSRQSGNEKALKPKHQNHARDRGQDV